MDGNHNKYLRLGAALLAGGLFGLTLKFPILSPLQIGAFAIYLYALNGIRNSYLLIALAGTICGIGNAYVRCFTLGLPTPVVLTLGATTITFFILVGLGFRWFYSANRLLTCFAFASWIVLIDWVQIAAIPLFGTAQSIVLSWSVFPWSIQYISITGILGIVFFVSLMGTLVFSALTYPESRKQCLTVFGAVLLVVVVANCVFWARASNGTATVAVYGYSDSDFPTETELVLSEHVAPALLEAASKGATIATFPEMTFIFSSHEEKANAIVDLQTLAKDNQIGIIAGYFDEAIEGNFAIQIDASGVVLGEHQKKHLVPLMEDYNRGSGKPIVREFGNMRTGVLICQDDNFTDISRALSREKAVIVGVPTLDWKSVANEHYLNSRFRAIESRYAIMRSADSGISAIISAKGKLLQSVNHIEQGARVIVSDVPLEKGGSWFSVWGHALMILISTLLLVISMLTRRSSNTVKRRDSSTRLDKQT